MERIRQQIAAVAFAGIENSFLRLCTIVFMGNCFGQSFENLKISQKSIDKDKKARVNGRKLDFGRKMWHFNQFFYRKIGAD